MKENTYNIPINLFRIVRFPLCFFPDMEFPRGSCPIAAQTAKESAYSKPSPSSAARSEEDEQDEPLQTATRVAWAHPGDGSQRGVKLCIQEPDQSFQTHQLTALQ